MTGLQAEQGRVEPTSVELAQAEVRRLTERQRLLPDLMREAATRGSYETVAKLRVEWEGLPLRLWAARYTAVQSELAAWDVRDRGARDRHSLLEQATELAQELRKR
jgi:hypothetical protein